MATTTTKKDSLDLPYQERLNIYKTDKAAAQKELLRAKDVYEKEKAAGASAERLNQISSWANQVRAASGISDSDPVYGNNNNVDPNAQRQITTTMLQTTSASGGSGSSGRSSGGSGGSGTMPTYQNPAPDSFAYNFLDMVKNMKPEQLQVYNPEMKEGRRVDLGQLFNQILATQPDREFSMDELRGLMNSVQNAGNRSTFTLDQLQQAIQGARNAGGGPIQVSAPRFQDTQQLGQLMNMMNELLRPQTEAQKTAAQTGFNQNMQALDNRLASRGLAASGVAGALMQQGANQLAGQLAQIEADQQARAIPLALNFADLALAEDAQRFNQQNVNRQFEAQQAQNMVGNLLNALGAQQSMNAFDLQRAQQGVANMLNALGLQENQVQNFLRNLMGATQMDVAQNQWAQEFGANRQDAAFNRWATTEQLNQQRMRDWLSAMANAVGMAEGNQQQNIQNAMQLSQMLGRFVYPTESGQALFDQVAGQQTQAARQFDQQFAENQRQFDQQLRENQRQYNIDAATRLTDMFGFPVFPMMGGQQLFDQLTGRTTLNNQNLQQQWQNMQDRLQLDRDQANLGWSRLNLDEQRFAQDQAQTLRDLATSGVLSEVLQFRSRDEAMGWLQNNWRQLADRQIDVSKVAQLINTLFGSPTSGGGAGSNPFSIPSLGN